MNLLVTSLFFLFPVLSLADGAPSWWSLPNKGANCVYRTGFTDGAVTCGTKKFDIWTCVETVGNAFSPATAKDYLLLGEYKSDVGGGVCQPVLVITKVVPQD